MSNIRQYLNQARNGAHERFMNADGFIDDDLQFTAGDDFMGANGQSDPNMGYSPAPKSQPYIVTISNASAATISNFDVLGAYTYLGQFASSFTAGSLTISGVSIQSAFSNVTYQEFLNQSAFSPFSVGETYLFSVSGSSAQVTQPITVNTRDANGNQALKNLIPTIDPYQNQLTAMSLKQPYRIDGYTKLTISSILPSVVFQVHFYPADNINVARGLSGRSVSRQYGSPGIVRSSIAVVGGDTLKARLGG